MKMPTPFRVHNHGKVRHFFYCNEDEARRACEIAKKQEGDFGRQKPGQMIEVPDEIWGTAYRVVVAAPVGEA